MRKCNRLEGVETERFKSFTYQELLKRDKLNLNMFWLKDALTRAMDRPAFEILRR